MNVEGLTNELMESAFFAKTKPIVVTQAQEEKEDTIEDKVTETQSVPSDKATSRHDVVMSPKIENKEIEETEYTNDSADNDITTSYLDVTENTENEANFETKILNEKRLTQIIQSILQIETVPFTTPVRMSVQEKKELEEYVTVKLKKRGVPKTKISISKVIRICTLYMMKNNEDEFTEILVKAIKNRGRLKF